MCSIIKYFVFITCLLLKFIGVDCSSIQCNDYRLSEFDGKAVTDFQLASFLHVEMAGLCTQRCSENHRCRSYRYNTRTRMCSTFGCGFSLPSKTLNPVTEEDGSRLYPFCGRPSFGMKCVTSSICAFGNSTCVDCVWGCVMGASYDVTTGPSFGMKCVTSSNCAFGNSTCVDGVCGCVMGTSCDVRTGDCLIRCTAYGSEISTYKDSGIHGCNANANTSSTMQACIATCKTETLFVCISVEFDHGDGTCNLCDTPALEFPEEDLEAGSSTNWTLAVRHCTY